MSEREQAGDAPTEAAAVPSAPWSSGDAPHLARAHAEVMHRLFGDPLHGRQRGRYRLLRELGRGGMGTVWAAEDPELDRRVAIKLLTARGAGTTRDSREQVRSLLREAQAIARLAHPHVALVYDVGADEAQPYIVMELVDGGSLSDWLAERERSVAEIVDALVQAGRGLAAAHRAGVLHRDFKPANVLRTRAGVCKVADFGLAIAQRELEGSTPAQVLAELGDAATEAGMAGTPAFMAPEQHAGTRLDVRTDVYALCVSAWLALTGAPPFRGSLASMVLAKSSGAPPRRRGTRLTPALWRVLARGLAPDPEQRWRDADSLCDALAQAIRPRRAPLAIAAVGGAALLFAAVPLFARDPVRACSDVDGLAWPGRRAEVEAALADAPTRSDQLAALDDWAQRWDRAREEVCEAIAGDRAGADARIACLAAARRQLDETLDGIATPATIEVRDRIAALADPHTCGTVIDEPPLSSEVAGLRAQLGALDAREQIGRDEAALAMAEALLADARAQNDRASVIHCNLVTARIAGALGQVELADRRGQEALWTALTAGDDVQAFDAALALVTIHVDAADYVTAERHARTAESLLLHLGDDPRRAARLERALGLVVGKTGRNEDGLAHYRRALELLGDADDPPLLAAIEVDIAAAELQLDDPISARTRFERAREVLAAWYGPEHLEVADAELMVAVATLGGPTPRTSVAPLERAIATFRARLQPGDPRLANALSVLAYVQGTFGEHERSVQSWRAVEQIHAATAGADHPRTLNAMAQAAVQLVELDRLDEAEPLALAAAEGLRAAGDPAIGHLPTALDVRGRIELRRGRTVQGVALFEEAIAAAQTFGDAELAIEPATHLAEAWILAGEHARARELLERVLAPTKARSIRRAVAELVLADALWADSTARALALAESARQVAALRGAPADTLARFDAWLRTHRGAEGAL